MSTPEQRLHLFNPIVQHRLRTTFGYFSGACAATGGLMFALRNSSLVYMNPWLMLGLSIGTMIGTHLLDYDT
jgi:hypothetical protein